MRQTTGHYPFAWMVLGWISGIVIVLGIMVIGAMLLVMPAHGRDADGRFAQSPLKPWFDSLTSGKGPCCSDADGSAVSDVDWETQNKEYSHYRVRLDVSKEAGKVQMEWIDVDDTAVVTVPNKVGKAMVWPVYGLKTTIRCFMPGMMS